MERYLKDEPHHALSACSSLSSGSSVGSPGALSAALRRADSFELLPCAQPASVCGPPADASPMWSWTVKREAPDADDTDPEDAVGAGQLFDDAPPSRACADQRKIALR